MSEEYFSEDRFQPDADVTVVFDEGVWIRSYRHTRWGLDAVAPYSTLVAQRIGNDQSLRFKPGSFSSSLVMAGNVSSQTIIGGFPADWPASGDLASPTGPDLTAPAQIASATFYDLAYIALYVDASANADAVGDFVGLFTGDVIIRCSDWSDWYTISYNTDNDSVYYDDYSEPAGWEVPKDWEDFWPGW